MWLPLISNSFLQTLYNKSLRPPHLFTIQISPLYSNPNLPFPTPPLCVLQSVAGILSLWVSSCSFSS
ncbi:hypothetical protein K7X08_018488 [Anisodus acutangulus]|uniref:Uncharacterized protein n=1 Tax=Anisodus acutangulus TaxID=402998 RepID=A0A9Q1LZQ2_9SOLA|nr:hypothetical protein K7X08_018488 [Anisodus acutangulus]